MNGLKLELNIKLWHKLLSAMVAQVQGHGVFI